MSLVLITGGSRGLGANTAEHFAKRGNDVIVTYRTNKAEADKVVAAVQKHGRKAAALQLEVGDVKAFDAFVAQLKETVTKTFGRADFDILVNNAGAGSHQVIGQISEEQFDEMINQHVKGPLFLTQKLLPLIKDGGSIVNVSSGLTRFSYPGYGAYASAKGAIEVFTQYLAKELGARRIRANVLAPGAIATDFGGGGVRDNAAINKMIADQTPLGRVGEADDIGSAIAALALEMTWVNGQRIEVSGGIHG